jgi:hypothetical protein
VRPRRHRFALPPPAIVGASDEERVVWLLIGEAQAQIARASARSDRDENNALGILGVDAAAIAALTATREALPPLWWVAVVALAACVPFLLATISPRRLLYLGPDLAAVHAAKVSRRALGAGLQLLTDLLECLDKNQRIWLPKATTFMLGLSFFVAGALFATAFLLRMTLVH